MPNFYTFVRYPEYPLRDEAIVDQNVEEDGKSKKKFVKPYRNSKKGNK